MDTLNLFANCTTLEDIKKEYYRLCKLWHPDLGPESEKMIRTQMMQQINQAYAIASAKARVAEAKAKARKEGKPEPKVEDIQDQSHIDEAVRAAIEKIIQYEFLEIEICGLWVWVGGTKKRGVAVEMDEALDALKAAGYRWAQKKGKWYFAGVPAGGFRAFSMDEIRTRYGSTTVKRVRNQQQKKEAETAQLAA